MKLLIIMSAFALVSVSCQQSSKGQAILPADEPQSKLQESLHPDTLKSEKDFTVSCHLMVSYHDGSGITLKINHAKPSEAKVKDGQIRVEANSSTDGYEIKTRLDRICASDGGPCTDLYDLTLEIENKASKLSSLTQTSVSSENKNKRLSTALNTDKTHAFANCDIK